MVLEAVAAGVRISVATEIGKDEEVGFAGVLGVALDGVPQFRAEAVRAADAFKIERVSAGMSDIDIVQRDPQQARREFAHQPLGDEHRKFVRAGERARMGSEIAE